jgi:hypothetical protein
MIQSAQLAAQRFYVNIVAKKRYYVLLFFEIYFDEILKTFAEMTNCRRFANLSCPSDKQRLSVCSCFPFKQNTVYVSFIILFHILKFRCKDTKYSEKSKPKNTLNLEKSKPKTAANLEKSKARRVWDGNTPLHEWTCDEKDRPKSTLSEL